MVSRQLQGVLQIRSLHAEVSGVGQAIPYPRTTWGVRGTLHSPGWPVGPVLAPVRVVPLLAAVRLVAVLPRAPSSPSPPLRAPAPTVQRLDRSVVLGTGPDGSELSQRGTVRSTAVPGRDGQLQGAEALSRRFLPERVQHHPRLCGTIPEGGPHAATLSRRAGV